MKHPVVIVADRTARVGDFLARLGDGAEGALADGRVFVGARRAGSAADPVSRGDEVRLYPARAAAGEAPRILFERGGVVAVYKPAAMATVADHHGAAGTLEREAAALLGARARPLTATSRLDVGVSGVVLFAADERSRAALARAREEGRYLRHYLALGGSAPDPARGEWSAPIGRASDPRRRQPFGRDASPASTAYEVRSVVDGGALLAVEPRTGRTHQIRVHAAHAGCPLVGDGVYGGRTRWTSARGAVYRAERIGLHAAWVEVPLPGAGTLRVEAPVPDDLRALWGACGGDPDAWGLALAPLS